MSNESQEYKTPLINIMTYGLPQKLAKPIFNEYNSRLSEAKYIINLSDRYKPLYKYMETVEVLLALTIFHKRVFSNLDSAVKFYGTVNRISEADTIKIGSYRFTGEEKNKILGLTMNYKELTLKFGLSDSLNNYELTKDFLKKLLMLLDFENPPKRSKRKKKDDDEITF